MSKMSKKDLFEKLHLKLEVDDPLEVARWKEGFIFAYRMYCTEEHLTDDQTLELVANYYCEENMK